MDVVWEWIFMNCHFFFLSLSQFMQLIYFQYLGNIKQATPLQEVF